MSSPHADSGPARCPLISTEAFDEVMKCVVTGKRAVDPLMCTSCNSIISAAVEPSLKGRCPVCNATSATVSTPTVFIAARIVSRLGDAVDRDLAASSEALNKRLKAYHDRFVDILTKASLLQCDSHITTCKLQFQMQQLNQQINFLQSNARNPDMALQNQFLQEQQQAMAVFQGALQNDTMKLQQHQAELTARLNAHTFITPNWEVVGPPKDSPLSALAAFKGESIPE